MKKTVHELNLINDFLFNEVLSDKENGALAAKLMLSVIMDCEIEDVILKTQDVITTGNPENHAIRLDVYIEELYGDKGEKKRVYDVEVQGEPGANLMPKRSRYYQALIDSKYLASGNNYNQMVPLWIIIITPKDLFGKNRMHYTFENRCIEEPELSLGDDAKRIFLNARGTVGQREELTQLLKYIVDSRDDNATGETTKKLHKIVEKVRSRPDVGVKYMKSWEREQFIREEGLVLGREEGREEQLTELLKKKLAKGQASREIADALEISVEKVEDMIRSLS